MGILTPNMVAELSSASYLTITQSVLKRKVLDISRNLAKHFNFDLSNGPIMGTSGGFVAQARGRQTGFALIGKSQGNTYKNDFVIAVRGTNF